MAGTHICAYPLDPYTDARHDITPRRRAHSAPCASWICACYCNQVHASFNCIKAAIRAAGLKFHDFDNLPQAPKVPCSFWLSSLSANTKHNTNDR